MVEILRELIIVAQVRSFDDRAVGGQWILLVLRFKADAAKGRAHLVEHGSVVAGRLKDVPAGPVIDLTNPRTEPIAARLDLDRWNGSHSPAPCLGNMAR